MKLISLSITFILIATHPFTKDIQSAADLLKSHKATVLHIKNTSATEGAEALAVVFPELIRWSAFQDLFETKADEWLYVSNGQLSANFSIGHFQMKPSFIEALEDYVATHTALSTFSYVVIKEKTEKEARQVRMYRLQQLDWQLRYAHVFWLVAMDKFKHRMFKTKQDRVCFFATAYNYGFNRPESEIEARLYRKTFPFGQNYTGEQVAYGDLAVEFLEKYAPTFEK